MLTFNTLKESGIGIIIVIGGGVLYIVILISVIFYELGLYILQSVSKKSKT